MMKMLTMLVALLLTACGSADPVQEADASTPQRFAGAAAVARDDRPLADRMTEANAADFATTDMDTVYPDLGADATPASTGTSTSISGTDDDYHTSDAAPMSVAPASKGGSCSDGKRVCGDMTDCADAVFHLQQCGMTRLDRDHDGTPCEKICG